MSVTYQLENGMAEIRIEGVCSPEELFGGFMGLLEDANLTDSTHILINVGKSDTLPPTEAIERIAHILGNAKEKFSGRVSVYVTRQVRFGIARQLSTYLESYAVAARPFYEYQPAVDWLNNG